MKLPKFPHSAMFVGVTAGGETEFLCRYQFDRLPSPPGHPGAFAPKCVPSPGAFARQKMPGGRANKG